MEKLADLGIVAIGGNTFKYKCFICNEERIRHGDLTTYRWLIWDRRAGKHRICCCWSCYIKALLKLTAEKKSLNDQDVLLLLRYNREVPWERVTSTALQSLPINLIPEHLRG